jgi:hypothetical protein
MLPINPDATVSPILFVVQNVPSEVLRTASYRLFIKFALNQYCYQNNHEGCHTSRNHLLEKKHPNLLSSRTCTATAAGPYRMQSRRSVNSPNSAHCMHAYTDSLPYIVQCPLPALEPTGTCTICQLILHLIELTLSCT